MKPLEISIIPILSDNYTYVLRCPETDTVAIVDCPDADTLVPILEERGLVPSIILNTHHHDDHVGGNRDLLKKFPTLRIYGYAADRARIPGITDVLEEGQHVDVGNHRAEVLFTPGHTSGHIAYYFADDHAVFCGDALFVAGCGRLFEGDAAQMHGSLQKLAQLPDATRVYCGHEYTLSSLRFAKHIEPNNAKTIEFEQQVEQLRAQDQPSIPSTIGLEKEINPFLRTHIAACQEKAQQHDPKASQPHEICGALRALKDNF
ncbi:MAG: hydroxyacylglutathione hydrolase [Myxococcota bacterium]